MSLTAVYAKYAAVRQRTAEEGTDFRLPVFLVVAQIGLIFINGAHDNGGTVPQYPASESFSRLNDRILIDVIALTVGRHDLRALTIAGGFKKNDGIGVKDAGGKSKYGFYGIFDNHGREGVEEKRDGSIVTAGRRRGKLFLPVKLEGWKVPFCCLSLQRIIFTAILRKNLCVFLQLFAPLGRHLGRFLRRWGDKRGDKTGLPESA